MVVTFRPASGNIAVPQLTPEVTPEVERLLTVCGESIARKELQAALHLQDEKDFRQVYLIPALQAGLIEMTLPEKPKSRFQKYRLTIKGRVWFAKHSS